MNKRQFIKNIGGATLGAAALATLPTGCASLVTVTPNKTNQVMRSKGAFPNVPVVTHDGQEVRFYDDLIKGKIVMINFMYAQCEKICPGMTANLKRVQKELGDRVGRDIFMYSISLTPEHDTPEVLKAYTQMHDIQPGWTFLTGKKADIEELRKHLGFSFSDPAIDKDKSQHLGVVKFGIESLERWGMSPALGDPKYIAEYLRWMEPNGSRPNLSEMMG
ncbi:SCO family protein [Crenothrix sp.]|uniref:SCO family protein n=1 Tax=Crenothrix sp. TaxID=3100433 RepID=UPI00374D1D7B